jgi:ABC-type sugar transport system substrate-binding protein
MVQNLTFDRRSLLSGSAALAAGVLVGEAAPTAPARAETPPACDVRPGYTGMPRSTLWSPTAIEYSDTSKYKKAVPYRIGFPNADIGDSWRVAMLHSMQAAISRHKDVVQKFIVTDANHNDAKQVSDIEDLISQGVDLLIVPAMEIFKQYPDIKIIDHVYTDFSSAKGKTETAAMIQKYGSQINGVLGQFGGQVSGSIEAFIDAGYGEGKIPAYTSTDYNGPMKLALK